jgi:thymidine phosphorylase
MLLVAGLVDSLVEGRRQAQQALASGEGYEAFCRYVSGCGGDSRVIEQPERALRGIHKTIVNSPEEGYLGAIDTARLGFLAGRLGAGRSRALDSIDPTAGIEMQVKIGDKISSGDSLAVLYSHDDVELDRARRDLPALLKFVSRKPAKEKLIIRRLTDG